MLNDKSILIAAKTLRHFLASVLLLLTTVTTHASIFTGASQLVAFGDSGTSTNPRITNDLVWVEYLGNSLGLSSASYAIPGAPTFGANGLDFQISEYVAANNGAPDPNAVHILLIGAHDARFALTPEESHSNRLAGMQRLIDNGASRIVVLSFDTQPNMYYTPEDIANYVPTGVTVLDLSGLDYKLADYGVTNLTTPCFDNLAICDSSRLYDYAHPASGLHRALAGEIEYQLTAVPLPASAWMFGSALVGLASMLRRRN